MEQREIPTISHNNVDIRARSDANTDEARAKGIFGWPSFRVGDEIFWGDDRLEDALDWATGRHPRPTAPPSS